MPEIVHVTALIRAFITPERRHRYLTLLSSTRGRAKLRSRLAHLRDLDTRYAFKLTPSEHTRAAVTQLLRARGAPEECVLLSEDTHRDGQVLPLDEAVSSVIGRGMGTFISCVPGRLAYYEGEGVGERYLLERSSNE